MDDRAAAAGFANACRAVAALAKEFPFFVISEVFVLEKAGHSVRPRFPIN